MRIVFFTMAMSKGGTERVISILCNHGFGEKDEIHICTCLAGKSQYPLKESVIVHSGFMSFQQHDELGRIRALPVLCKRYIQEMKQINPDIILSFLPEPCFIAGLCKKNVGKILIGSERANPYVEYRSPLHKAMVSWLYPKLDGFVFQTDDAKTYFGKKVQKKSVIIGNPISVPEQFRKLPEQRLKEIVSVGRFTPEKNYTMLLRGFGRVVKRNKDYVLKIYGKVDERLKLKELSNELGISDRVFFMGQVDNVLERIRNASVFVLSSISEGMPNALMEAMALGLPVVATDCPSGGPKQLIRDGENGLLVQNNNEEALAYAINRVIEDEQLSHNLSINALGIADEYSEEKICHQWKAYIESVVEEKSKNE